MYTNQEAFNIIYTYYKNGGKPGYNSVTTECVYNTGDGGYCPIGVLLKNNGLLEKLLPSDMSLSYNDLCKKYPDIKIVDKTFGSDLQRYHDYGVKRGALLKELEELAKGYNLTI